MDLNQDEKTDLPQIHLSAVDGETKEEATEIVFHKMADGNLFIEWYPHIGIQKELNCVQLQTILNNSAKIKLIEFLNSTITY